MSWTDERVEKLKEYWAEGMSASQIAKQLGGVTRNAVIGKVHRLGLSHRNNTDAPGAAEETPVETRTAGTDGPDPVSDTDPGIDAPTPAPVQAEPAPEPAEVAVEATVATVVAMPRTPPAVRDPLQPRAPGQPTPEEEQARITLAEIEKMAKKLGLMELTERTCKWPIGDPAEDGFHFCGLPASDGKPYCVHHVAIAFQPMSTRRDRSRSR